MADEEAEIYAQRLEKAQKWREKGFNPWGNGHRPGERIGDLTGKWGKSKPEEVEQAAVSVSIAGRIVEDRAFGKMSFIRLRDRTDQIQVMLKKDALGEGFELYKLTDVGDFVAVAGKLIVTKTGELTVQAAKFTPLTKSLRPLPEKWHGLADTE